MHGNQQIMWVALAVAVGIPVLLFRRKKKILSGFDDLIAARHFVARNGAPVAAFAQPNPPLGLHFSKAYDGQLRPDVSMSLLMLKRNEPVIVNGVSVQNATIYVGAYLPTQPSMNPTVQKSWQEKADQKRDDVVYASLTPEGGFVIVWKGAPSRPNVEAHLDAVARSLH